MIDAVAAVMLASLIAYCVLAGADFGGGVWDLLATGPRAIVLFLVCPVPPVGQPPAAA